MSQYVDGFVIPIKKKNINAYRKLAKLGCRLWMKYGALRYYECLGEELKNNCGWTFPRMCKLMAGETAIFAFIVYKSKAHRNQVNAKVMKDPSLNMEGVKMPFDMKRFAMGGFKAIVHSK